MDTAKTRQFLKAMKLGHHKVTTRMACEDPSVVEAAGVTIDDVLDAFTKYNGIVTGVYGTHLECILQLLRAGWKISDERIREFFVIGHKWEFLGRPVSYGDIGDSMVLLMAEMHRLRPDIVRDEDLYDDRVFHRMLKLDRAKQRKVARFWPTLAAEIKARSAHAA